MVEGALEAFPSPEEFLVASIASNLSKNVYVVIRRMMFGEDFCSSPTPRQELATQGGWVHAAPFLLSTGMLSCTDLSPEKGFDELSLSPYDHSGPFQGILAKSEHVSI